MSRAYGLNDRQALLNKEVSDLRAGRKSIDASVDILAETTCIGRPFMEEWDDATRPAKATDRQLKFLASLLDGDLSPRTREYLELALDNLTAEPVEWVKQLELQAEFDDAFNGMRTFLESVNVLVQEARLEKRRVTTPTRSALDLAKDLYPFIDARLDKLVVLTCPHSTDDGAIAYATAEQQAWLESKEAKLLFKRAGFSTQKESISRKGSDYFYLLNHIAVAGVLEEQEFYNTFELGEDFPDFELSEEAAEFAKAYRASISNKDGVPGTPIDENTVAIDETIVETD